MPPCVWYCSARAEDTVYPRGPLPDLGVNEVLDFLWSLYNNFTRKVKDKVHNNREKEERYRWSAFHLWTQILYKFIPKEELQCNIILIYFLLMGKKILLILAKFWWYPQIMPSPNRLPGEARPQDKPSVFPCTFTLDAAL